MAFPGKETWPGVHIQSVTQACQDSHLFNAELFYPVQFPVSPANRIHLLSVLSMRRFLLSTLQFFVLLLALSYPVAWYLDEHFNTYSKQNWILNLQGEKLDYAVIGSSRVFNMVDMRALNKSYGKKGINLGTSGSSYAENYVLLSEFVRSNSISTLLLNVDEFCFNSAASYSYPFHDNEFANLFKRHEDVFRDFIPGWKYYLWKTVPASKYFEFNKFTFRAKPDPSLNAALGTSLVDGGDDEKPTRLKKNQTGLNEKDKKYFIKIIQWCNEKKIRLILITTPMYPSKTDKNELVERYIDSVATVNKLPYYHYHGLIDTSNPRYFKDNTHTNAAGSIEYSNNLGILLKQSE
jgi:hypothetical protein